MQPMKKFQYSCQFSTITLHGSLQPTSMLEQETRTLLHEWRCFELTRKETRSNMAEQANIRATQNTAQQETLWDVGDEIVIASTDYDLYQLQENSII